MISVDEQSLHSEVWLLLPWLVNGRLSQAEHEQAQAHVRHCAACQQELAVQQLLCNALTEPDRVTHTPAPSFRKLMDRIDSAAESAHPVHRPATRPLAARLGHVSLWRPPGLAWAASFLLLFAVTGLVATTYRWSAPRYVTHTDATPAAPDVLHIALDRALTLGEVEELLRTNGARIVEGPGNTGVFGVTPDVAGGPVSAPEAAKQLKVLAERLQRDSRVLWVQPLAGAAARKPADKRTPAAQDP